MIIFGILSTLVSLALPIVAVVLIVRYASRQGGGRVGDGHGVRRFFQYVLLFGLLVVVSSGVSDLLGELFAAPAIVTGGGDLARALTFVVVGIPVFGLLAAWTRRTHRDPGEARSLGWAAYLTFAGLTAAVVGATAVYDLVAAGLADARFEGPALIRLLVWGGVWAAHRVLGDRTQPPAHGVIHLLLGSLIGLGTSIVGLVALLAAALDLLAVPRSDLIVGTASGLGYAAAVVAAGVPLWAAYWLLRLGRSRGTAVWLGYVLVVGVGVSTVMTITGASIGGYRALVWFLGDPATTDPGDYLQGTSVAIAVAVVGAISWWHHRELLAQHASAERTEVTRIYEYLLSAVALLAAAVGLALVVVAFIQAVAPPPGLIVATSYVNAVLAAVTLLVVGGPLWWAYWRRIARAAAADPTREATSPTRRAYIFVLFGVAGVVAVVVVLVAVFLVIEDAIGDGVGSGTLRDVRVPLGMLVSAGAVSGYHWLIYRADRRLTPAAPARHGPRQVLLVGPRDDALVAAVRRASGSRVEVWFAEGPPWDADAVLAALADVDREQLLFLSDTGGAQVVAAGARLGPDPLGVSAADAGEDGDQPGRGSGRGERQLDDHPERRRPDGDPRGRPRRTAVTQSAVLHQVEGEREEEEQPRHREHEEADHPGQARHHER
jgi:hypothetical protein